jgi:hypothetical protein
MTEKILNKKEEKQRRADHGDIEAGWTCRA